MTRTPEVGVDHLTLLDVSTPDMVTIAYEVGFDSVSLRVSAWTPDEESWLMNAGSPRLEETICRLDNTNARVLSV
jgi:hypothetical protein